MTTKQTMRTLTLLLILLTSFCNQGQLVPGKIYINEVQTIADPIVGAERLDLYIPAIQNLRVGVVANQTSTIDKKHLVDVLLEQQIDVKMVFAPEHGFRGQAANGEHVSSGKDEKTGLPMISLYGKHKKPSPQDCAQIDAFVFDIQDVGARFYTYISTLHYVMEAAAENGKKVIVLDRPNPNGYYVDGPVLDLSFQSFVGMHPIPTVHGLTVGELALMINGEGWLKAGLTCDLQVVPCEGYDHSMTHDLPIAPSPNLPNFEAVQLYPSLCFFEGTIVSVGRGTDFPFQAIGLPNYHDGNFKFTPKHLPGIAAHPPYEGEECSGHLLKNMGSFYFTASKRLNLDWLIEMYSSNKDNFFKTNFFDKLAGTDELRLAIIAGKTSEEIHEEWQDALFVYKVMRKKYLLYTDFE